VLDPGHTEPLGRHLHDEAAQATAARRVRVRDRKDGQAIGHRALADEPLRAGQHVRVAITDRPGADRGSVGAGLGLGQGERDEVLTAGEARQPTGLLLGRPGERDGQRPELVDREDQAGRGARAAQLLDGEADAQQLPAKTTIGLGEWQGEDVLLGEERLEVPWELAGPVDLGRTWRDTLVGERPDRVTQESLGLREPVAGRIGRGRHRDHRIPSRTGSETPPREVLLGPVQCVPVAFSATTRTLVGSRRGVRNGGAGGGVARSSGRLRTGIMDADSGLLLLITAAAVGIVATIQILRRDRQLQLQAVDHESPFAVSTEGMERCPSCGMGNLVGDRTCSACGKPLPEAAQKTLWN